MTMVFSKLTAGVSALIVIAGLAFAVTVAYAAKYPKIKAKEQNWSFAGPFGTYDKGQLQRGLKVFTETCAVCHSLNLISYRNLADLGYSKEQIKNYAAEFEVTDGPNEEGEMFERPANPNDRFKNPYENNKAAAAANGGAMPPDLSLMARARGPERGFPTFIFDVFTMYQEGGSDYIVALLKGYQDAPAGEEVSDGLYYNPSFISGTKLAMAPPLSDGSVDYDDGTPNTLDQQAKDVAAFLSWTADPNLPQRKQRGFIVMLFLFLFAGLLYFTKKKVWSNVAH